MKGLGGLFERQALASMPGWAYSRKVPDPPTRPFRCQCGGQITPKCDRCGAGHGHPATFTRGNPWDVEVRWLSIGRRFELLVECKSTAVPRLAFSEVDAWKAQELRKAAEARSFAGVLWECRSPLAVYYLPIATWLELEQGIGRKSIPLDVAAARGIRVEIDTGRGRKRTYYRMDELLRTLAQGG